LRLFDPILDPEFFNISQNAYNLIMNFGGKMYHRSIQYLAIRGGDRWKMIGDSARRTQKRIFYMEKLFVGRNTNATVKSGTMTIVRFVGKSLPNQITFPKRFMKAILL
jgi:hypothetical protein